MAQAQAELTKAQRQYKQSEANSSSLNSQVVVRNDEINSAMVESGVMEQGNRDNAWSYIERESRPKGNEGILSDGKSSGKMYWLGEQY